jgi:hypothetical protein
MLLLNSHRDANFANGRQKLKSGSCLMRTRGPSALLTRGKGISCCSTGARGHFSFKKLGGHGVEERNGSSTGV